MWQTEVWKGLERADTCTVRPDHGPGVPARPSVADGAARHSVVDALRWSTVSDGRAIVSPTLLLVLAAVIVAAFATAVAAGQQPVTAGSWLCLAVAVAGAWSGMRALFAAVCASVITTGLWLVEPVRPSVALVLLQIGLLVGTGQLVAHLARRVREADRDVLVALEGERTRALEAVAERDALSTRLAHQAMHDMLTGLPNRSAFLDRLTSTLRELEDGKEVGVLFIDLDDFKIVNDSLGHAAGDELLVGVAERLRNALRDGDLVSRFGGDEFAVLLPGRDADEHVGVATRLLGVLRAPFALTHGMASGQASGGLVHEPRDPSRSVEDQAADLMRKADLAMYAAKAAGGGRCVPYRNEMQDSMLERLALQDEIRHALINDQFVLCYQPVVEIGTSRVVAVEALARWHHPERGDVPPSEFIPVAEESGTIVDLGMWVLEQACLDLQLWDELCPGNGVSIAVNVSARQLREVSVGPQVARILHRTGVDPRRLVLEVTESLLMDDGEAAAATLWQMRGLGIRIAVDDFGTGYSSLSRLVDLPIDDLKIDRAFVAELNRSGAGATIVNAAVAMAHGLGLTVVAEGVETEEQLDFLVRAGCDHAQGYLFTPPVPMDAVSGMLRRGVCPPRSRVPEPREATVTPLSGRPSRTVLPSAPRHR